MGALKAGIGVAVITPPVGIEMGAWALRRGRCQGVHDEMLARALVLDDGSTAAAIVSLDVVAISTELTNQVRELVAAQTDIRKTNILLNCSHTHTTPFTGGMATKRAELSLGHLAYLKTFPHYVAGAIVEAWHNRANAAIGGASTLAPGLTVNRRDPSLPVDPALGVIRVDDEDGQPMACLINYACHGTTVGAHYLEWTADFPGYLARTVEQSVPGATCLFLQGAEGDIHPWDWYFGNPEPRFGDTYEAAERLGKAIAGRALGLFQQIGTDSSAEINVAATLVTLPPRPIKWTAQEAESFLTRVEAATEPYDNPVIPDGCPGCMSAQRFPGPYRLLGARHEARFARDYPPGIDAELTVLRINDIVLAANPGEPFSELGRRIGQGSPFENTFVLSLTNGSIAYIPVREAAEAVLDLSLEEFIDPVKHRNHYGATITTEIGPSGGDIFVQETLGLIASV
jgi:neutral ceramidase